MSMSNLTSFLSFFITTFAVLAQPPADNRDNFKIGRQSDGSIVVPTNQVLTPAGTQVLFQGRPVDLALTEGGKALVAKNMRNLVFIDIATGRIKQTLELHADDSPEPVFNIKNLVTKPIGPDGKPHSGYPAGFSVVGILNDNDRIYVSDSQNRLRVAERRIDGKYAWARPIVLKAPKVGGYVFPTGIARQSANKLWVASCRGNSVQLVNLTTGQIEQEVSVGVAPYTIVCARPERVYVTNWGGDPPGPNDPQALSSLTAVRINPTTGIANTGTVSVLGQVEGKWQKLKSIAVGLHPSGLVASHSGKFVYVANANSDTVSVVDTESDHVVETIPCRPEASLPFGSGANAVALSPSGDLLYVANGTNNCIAVVRLGARVRESALRGPEATTVTGLIPTGWYPGAVLCSSDGEKLFVANVKGVGALAQLRPADEGKNTHDFLGSVSIIGAWNDSQLAKYTEEVNHNNRLAFSRAGLEPPRKSVAPTPVPARHGESSVFKHVIYIIKENRGYDQIFGDIKEGDGDPSLLVFGEETTPNQHALARQFTLFDNFYCSSSLSATGHQWTNEAYVTDYLTKTFGGFTRSYPVDGDDPLAFASSGFLWGNALRRGLTFRNYGEFTRTWYAPANATWGDVYRDYKNQTRAVQIEVKPNVAALAPYTHPGYPGFPLVTPDVYRAQIFLEEFKEFEKRGELPNLIYIFLPCDHTVGTQPGFPTPRAMVADNDLALGRIAEAVSASKFWRDSCIFVVEDDPQFSFDHVDAHRSIAQVISPFTKRRFVDHTNYNQTGMVKTIELILGLSCMNQLDLSATPMRNCFMQEPDLTPYRSVPNRVPLDDINLSLEKLPADARYWARKSMELDLGEADEADEDTLNHIIWHATRGYQTPYPERSTKPAKNWNESR
jgi:YVTN family beta-propeller protein